MAEKTSGIYSVVLNPRIYLSIQNLLGGYEARKRFGEELFGETTGKKILEIGCGPGTWYPEFSDCETYVGMDWNERHIASANEKYGASDAVFLCGDIAKDLPNEFGKFDYCVAFGLLHHLDDDQAASLMESCTKKLKAKGQFISIDPVFHERQNPIARIMNHLDSGKNIRTEQQYRNLVEPSFKSVQTQITKDRLRIPYSHCIMTAS